MRPGTPSNSGDRHHILLVVAVILIAVNLISGRRST
jgi:hypothetical protein